MHYGDYAWKRHLAPCLLAYSIHQTVWTMVQSLTSPTFGLEGPVLGLRVIANGSFVTCRSCLGFKLFLSLLVSSPFCYLNRLRVCSPALPSPLASFLGRLSKNQRIREKK